MTRDETLDRLRAATAGRIAISRQALPYIFLAQIRLVERGEEPPSVVVTIDPVTTAPDALHQVVIAVHTDGTDPSGERWEVLVQGLSTLPEATSRTARSVRRMSAGSPDRAAQRKGPRPSQNWGRMKAGTKPG